MASITTNPNPLILNLPAIQNTATSATGLTDTTALYLNSASAALQINSITAYNSKYLTIKSNTNFSNANILMNGSNLLTSNSFNGQGYVSFQLNGSEKARLTTTGLGLFTTNPSASLDIVGDEIIRGNLYVRNTPTSTTLGNITIDGNVTANGIYYPSDENLKKNIQPYICKQLPEAVEFEWKKTGKRDIGVLASDVYAIEPDCVHVRQDGMQTVDYSKLVVLCLAEIKQMKQTIQELKARLVV